MKRPHSAVSDFRIVVDANPNVKEDRLNLCHALFDSGKYTEAVDGKDSFVGARMLFNIM